ncbi:hypothetical protein QCE47_02755 [Caballeronia sp. LZ025]|uniref:virion core protein, T7 gp14 family n=1 Tax=Caballeronia TaxID=1827195 RepID=UPI001FD01AF5|nr:MULTISPECIES: hypothetical protein [Caballeronia]MDR5731270.1 hypothetical protein [Caballeronia sp. LZ025]
MCDGLSEATMVAMAVSAAASAAAAVQQSQVAHRQTDAAQSAYDQQVMQIKNQQVEQSQAASAQMSERARQALVETGHLQALANESGTNGGGSNDRVTNEANFNSGTDIATMQANAASQQRDLANQARGAAAQASQRMSSIQQPSLIGTGLQIAASTTSLYASQQRANDAASGRIPNRQGNT